MSAFTPSSLDSSTASPYVLSTKPVPASEVGSTPLPLDWTRMTAGGECAEEVIRLPLDVVDYEVDPTETNLSVIGTAGKKITKIDGIEHLRLEQLTLRSHLIRTMENLESQTDLVHLELYDNAIDALNQLESFPRLTVLDISFNVIRDMSTVNHLPLLVELYIANNKIVELKGLENLTALKTLDAGANRIRTMDGLSGLTSIEHLWLGKNKITAISGISNLKNIRRLDVQSNRLTVVDNLEGQVDSLEELYLGSNGIDDEGIEQAPAGLTTLVFPNLSVLDLSKNKVSKLDHFKNLTGLDDIWFSENNVSDFAQVESLKEVGLETIYLEHNPVAKDSEYRKKVKELLPTLTQIDANAIGYEGRGWGGGGLNGVNGVQGFGQGSMTDAQRLLMMQKLQQATVDRAKVQAAAAAEK